MQLDSPNSCQGHGNLCTVLVMGGSASNKKSHLHEHFISQSGLYRHRVCLRNRVLFQAADYRVLRSVFLGIAGAEEGQQETLVGTGFSVLASQRAQGFGFTYMD